MYEQRQQFRRTVLAATMTGVVMGVAYAVLMYCLEDAIRAAESLQLGTPRSWSPSLLFILVSAAFG